MRVLEKKSDHINAVELYRLSAEILRAKEGLQNSYLLSIYIKMAKVLGLNLGEHDKSLKIYRTVIDLNRGNIEGISPIFIFRALEGQGDVLFDKRDYYLALRKFQLVLQFLNKAESNESVKLYPIFIRDSRIDNILKLGRTYGRKKQNEKALETLNEGLQIIREEKLPEEECSTQAAFYLYEMGLIYRDLKDRSNALQKFNRASKCLGTISSLDSQGQNLLKEINKQIGQIDKTRFLFWFRC